MCIKYVYLISTGKCQIIRYRKVIPRRLKDNSLQNINIFAYITAFQFAPMDTM